MLDTLLTPSAFLILGFDVSNRATRVGSNGPGPFPTSPSMTISRNGSAQSAVGAIQGLVENREIA